MGVEKGRDTVHVELCLPWAVPVLRVAACHTCETTLLGLEAEEHD